MCEHWTVTKDVADSGDGQGLDAAAARAVALADLEAYQLGHDRVGTEHLLLGLLTNDSDVSSLLSEAGVTLAAARNKVIEAVGASGGERAAARTRPLPRTARATRALGRSLRFAHARGADQVASHHLLMGVLDVEGIAGQVLRGLGLDVESLRATIDAAADVATLDRNRQSEFDLGASKAATCPSCNADLGRDLIYRVVAAEGENRRTRDAVVFMCGVCGRFLGAGSA